MKILIADPLSENGHLKFNKKILDWFSYEKIDSITFFSKSMAANLNIISDHNVSTFADSYIRKDSRFRYFLCQIALHFKLLTICLKSKCSLILLSYELQSFLFFSYIYRLFNVKVMVIEHNTIPDNKTSFKGMLYNSIDSKVFHICLEEYISENIKKQYAKKADYFSHPITISDDDVLSVINSDCDGRREKNLFMPSSTINSAVADSIILSCLKNKIILIMKNLGNIESHEVLKREHFDNYYEIMKSCDGVIIPQVFTYRVSGVFYEALALNVKIYMAKSLFSKEMKLIYPDNIAIYDECDPFCFESSIGSNVKFNIEKYNLSSRSRFIKACYDFH